MIKLLFFIFFVAASCLKISPTEKYTRRFSPKTLTFGDHVRRQYPKFIMEVTLSFGMTEDTTRFIEAVIEQNFNGNMRNTEEMNEIQETVQSYLGGYWTVQFFDDPYMFYSTTIRRSASFVVLDVNGAGIAVMKEI